MRPQQNRRISNVRRGAAALRRAPNPLTRNYESSGPDVKIRGNAQHIAEKYLALARDAQASGDRVMGENYLQHAEHYTRIILSAQSHEQSARAERSEAEEPRENMAFRAAEPAEMDNEDEDNAPQPVIEGVPGEVALMGRGGYKRSEAAEDSATQPRRRRLPARRAAGQPRRRSEAEESDESRAERAERPEYSERAAGAEPAEHSERTGRTESAEPAERFSRAESWEAAEQPQAEDAPRAPRRRASAAANDRAEGAEDNAAGAEGMEAAAKPRLRRPRRAKAAAETEQPGNI